MFYLLIFSVLVVDLLSVDLLYSKILTYEMEVLVWILLKSLERICTNIGFKKDFHKKNSQKNVVCIEHILVLLNAIVCSGQAKWEHYDPKKLNLA